jgi:hypothetical protein
MNPKVIAAISAVVGVMTFIHLNTSLAAYMDPLLKVCFKPATEDEEDVKPSHFRVGVAPIDGLHCLLTPFFIDTVKLTSGRLATAETLSTVFGKHIWARFKQIQRMMSTALAK